MTTIVADACFLIALQGSGNLGLLTRAKLELGWKVVVPDAVFQESTKREARYIKALLANSTIERVDPSSVSIDRLSNRYPMLGKGEIEAIAYVLMQENREGVIIMSDDQRARKAIREQQLTCMSTLDFLSRMCHKSMVTKEEVLRCIPALREVMWISDEAIKTFTSSL